MQLVQDLHMRCYRLHLRLVALCQSISLEPPYYTKIEFQGHPHHRHTKGLEPHVLAYVPVSTILRERLADVSMVEVEGVEPSSFRLYC